MRVLVADQETERLEAIARVFEVDVATSKVTCIDLLRANNFDVVVACERLSDGSGLELLSQVGQRWPGVVRILAIEPERRAMLKGRLGPFKLFETIAYPIDEDRLEAALTRAAEALARVAAGGELTPPAPKASSVPPASRSAPASRSTPASKPVTREPTRVTRPTVVSASPVAASRRSGSSAQQPPGYPPLPRKGSKIVPLGSPETAQYRILPHDYNAQHMPGTLPARRESEVRKEASLQEKAAALAADAVSAVTGFVRNIKAPGPPPPPPPTAPSRKKR